jgi:hypothetical protein
VQAWPDVMKTSFRDRHERPRYLKACETARRIVEERMAPDPQGAAGR